MPVTWHGPASTTVTRSTRPSSWKTCVIPIFFPNRAAIRRLRKPSSPRTQGAWRPPGRERPRTPECEGLQGPPSDQLDLDVNARGKMIEALKRVDGLRGGLKDVDQPLVRADLEVLARVLVLERAADHAVDVLLGRERHGTGDARAGARGGLDDLLGGRLDRRVVVRLQADADLVLRQCCHESSGQSCRVPDVRRAGPGTEILGPAPLRQ